VEPQIGTSGLLNFTPAPGASGYTLCSVVLSDGEHITYQQLGIEVLKREAHYIFTQYWISLSMNL
jgi:hypothetical protein